MTPAAFRKLALSLDETTEQSHMNHPDFRRNGKIFATLGYPDKKWAMVKLPPEQQANFVQTFPNVFIPVKGKWGLQGATSVLLSAAEPAIVLRALKEAWTIAVAKPARKKRRGV